jgi:hypothetical protein
MGKKKSQKRIGISDEDVCTYRTGEILQARRAMSLSTDGFISGFYEEGWQAVLLLTS